MMAAKTPPTGSNIPYGDYGYIPGVAQQMQSAVYAPFIPNRPVFTNEQLQIANWWTSRVHLAPLGKA